MTGPMVTVEIDQQKLRAVERALRGTKGTLPKVMVTALGKTAKAGRTGIDRDVRREIAAKKRDVMKRIVDEIKATRTNWRWRLGISGKRLAVSAFPHQPKTPQQQRGSKKDGVTYTIRPGQGKRIPTAFVARMKYAEPSEHGGHETYTAVFRRAEPGDKTYGRWAARPEGEQGGRPPLIFLRGPSIGRVVRNAPAILQKAQMEGTERLVREVNSQVSRYVLARWPR